MEGKIGSMQITDQLLFCFSLFALYIPFVMAWLSLTLKDKANRWTNLIVSIISFIFIVISLLFGISSGESIALLINYILDIVVCALIIWYSWKWPRATAKV
jgi:L-lactate permease